MGVLLLLADAATPAAAVARISNLAYWHSFCCRNFLKLHPRQRAKAVDALAANLCTLCTSAHNLLSNYEAASAEAILRHKNGLKMFVQLLHVIAMQAEKDTQQAKGAENAAKPKPAGGQRSTAQCNEP